MSEHVCERKETEKVDERKRGGRNTPTRTHMRTHSQTASRHKDSVLSESMFLCVKRIGLSNSPLAISSSP